MFEGRPTRRPAVPSAIAPFLPHLLAVVVALSAVSIVSDPTTGAILIGATSAAFAVAVTLNHGGAYLPPSTIYFMASGVFIGGGVYYLLIVDTRVPVASIRDAATLALVSTIGISIALRIQTSRWRVTWPTPDGGNQRRQRPYPPSILPVTGVALMILSQIGGLKTFVGPTSYSIGLAGVMLVVVWASSRWGQLQWFGDVFVVALVFVLPWLWVQMTFSGGGRLMIAGVCIASFLVWNVFNPSRTQKVLLIACIPLFLIFAGLNRASDSDASTSSSVISKGDGLGSVYSPLETFARMIGPLDRDQRQALGPRDGGTFVNTFYLPIPRAIWPDKPEGFGAELTAVLEPSLVKVNHSMAALSQGEWYANFGFAGMALMVPATGLFLAWLDRRHARLVTADYRVDREWWNLAFVGCLASSLGDLCWVGTFMIYARGGLAAIVVWVSSLVATARRREGALPGNRYVDRPPPRRPRSGAPEPTSAVEPEAEVVEIPPEVMGRSR